MPSNCKYIKQDYDWTPNDYDIEFNYNNIPSNIEWHGGEDIELLLNQYAPITKTLHLTMNIMEKETINGVKLNTKTIFEART